MSESDGTELEIVPRDLPVRDDGILHEPSCRDGDQCTCGQSGTFVRIIDRHGKEIPARDVTAQVDCGDGAVMTIVNPYSEDNVEWGLRYGNAERMRYVAASLLDSYDYLLSGNINMAEATRRLRLMRAKRRDLRDTAVSSNSVRELTS